MTVPATAIPTDPKAEALFRPLKVGAIETPNRVLMAPLTRSRASQPGDVPTELNATYYAQRAGAGLIVSEASQVSPQGKGYAFTPGIHSDEQVAGWKLVTDAVHERGGRIVLQLWHVGRISHVDLQEGGVKPVAPSAIRAESQTYTEKSNGMVPVSEPRALETAEIPSVIEQFRRGAENAKAAGFDGVEIHGANGYLLDQFLRTRSNTRTDGYGGSVENRIRFGRKVAEAVVDVWGADRVGYRVSPLGGFNSMTDDDPHETFGAMAESLGELGLAFIHVVEAFGDQERDAESERVYREVRDRFKSGGGGVYIANGEYDGPTGAARVADGKADAVTYGTLYIANPDLDERIRRGGPFNEPDQSTFYGGTEKGYTDYPLLG